MNDLFTRVEPIGDLTIENGEVVSMTRPGDGNRTGVAAVLYGLFRDKPCRKAGGRRYGLTLEYDADAMLYIFSYYTPRQAEGSELLAASLTELLCRWPGG